MSDLFSVKDKVIAITGGGGVLCGAMARSLGAAGAKIAVLDLNEAAAGEVAGEINSTGGKAIAVKCIASRPPRAKLPLNSARSIF
jgi:NAD(P)-dependent dehydrogenase (short-subunit alcohol dehydrogenase family)